MNAEQYVPEAAKPLVITGGVGRMVMVNVEEPVPPALMALMVAANVPLTVGMPEINPVDQFQPTPGGRPLALKLVGLLAAVIR